MTKCYAFNFSLQHFTLEDYDALISGWEKKLKRCSVGYQKWGLFYAKKAA
jgi:phosphoethanolamine N-methyltransferase